MSSKDEIDELMKSGYEKYQFGEYLSALEFFSQALKLAKKNNLVKDECITIKMEATALYRLARYKDSEEKYNLALKIAIQNGFKTQECKIYNHLIALYEMLNDYVKAKECMDKGFKLAIELKDIHSQAKLLNSKGVYFHIFGNDQEALRCYEESMELYKKSDDKRGLGTCFNLIAGYYYLLEDYLKAMDFFRKANEIGNQLPDFDMKALSACRMGLIFYKQNDFDKALKLLENPDFFAEKIENKKIIVEVYYTKALIFSKLDNIELAFENFKKSEELAREIGNEYLLARVKIYFGTFYYDVDDLEKSFLYIKESFDLLNKISNSIEISELEKQIRDIYQGLPEFLWLISEISPKFRAMLELEDIRHLRNNIYLQCTTCQTVIEDIQLKLDVKIKSTHIIKILDNLIRENEENKLEIQELKNELIKLKNELENVMENPLDYKEIDQDKLKAFINSSFWSENENKLKHTYLRGIYKKIDSNSKTELILMLIMLELVEYSYKICAFLLTKTIERELRLNIFSNFKEYWNNKLNKPDYSKKMIINDKKWLNFAENCNKTLLKYLSGIKSLTLGNINVILKEANFYCRYKKNKTNILGWEADFINCFKQFCFFINKVLTGFKFIQIDELREKFFEKKVSEEYYCLYEFLKTIEDIDDVILEFTGAGCHKYAIKRALELSNDKIIIICCKNRDFSIISERLKNKELNENFPFNTDIGSHINFIKGELDDKTIESFWKIRNSILINVYMDMTEDIAENIKVIKSKVNLMREND